MKRAFWFVAGAASGVYGMVKVRRTLENFTPDGIGARVAAARAGVRMFADEVAAGMHEKEADLLAELDTDAASGHQLDQNPVPEQITAKGSLDNPPQITREGVTDGYR